MTGRHITSECKCDPSSYYPRSHPGPLRFVDRDMFVRYTHYGIGHPKVLQEMARDCANADLTDSTGPEEDRDHDQERVLNFCEGDSGRDRGDDSNEGEDQEDQDDEDEDATECDDDELLGYDYPDDWEIEDVEAEEDEHISF